MKLENVTFGHVVAAVAILGIGVGTFFFVTNFSSPDRSGLAEKLTMAESCEKISPSTYRCCDAITGQYRRANISVGKPVFMCKKVTLKVTDSRIEVSGIK